jgi:anthranilate phosphoribosyltransferase
VLEALGARIDLGPEAVARCIDEAGFGFMFAPAHHQATRFVVPVRRELAVRTIFNFLGPLTNPAGARRQLIGVSDPAYLERMAGALARLGVDRALVVSSEDGLDEMSTSAPTHVVEVNGNAIERYVVTPQDVGIDTTTPDAVTGGTPDANARITRAILDGEPGPAREIALLNAGAAIYAAGVADTLRDGVDAAREAIDSGAALRTTEAYLDLSRELATA